MSQASDEGLPCSPLIFAISTNVMQIGVSYVLESLYKYFGQYGELTEVILKRDTTTGRSRGFGFVAFADPKVVNRVLQDHSHSIDGKIVMCIPVNPSLCGI